MIFILFITAALLVIALVSVLNAVCFPRLRARSMPAASARVSVLIPARNEAAVIADTVRSVMAQRYPHFELILLDDHSTDGTAAVAQAAAQGDERLRIVSGEPLPAGWLGKNWACHQLAQAAAGDILIFMDADVRWEADALASMIDMMTRAQADLLTIWPTQQTVTWGERLVVPLMALAIIGYLPILPVHYTRWAAFAAACGQCMVFRRAAYFKPGGHAAVRADVVEDVALARRTKAHGLRLWMADGAGLVGCRMYPDWAAVRDGFAKNILAGHGGGLPLLLSTVFHWSLFVFPWLWLLGASDKGWPLLLIVLGVGARALSAAVTRQRVADALLMPFSVLLMTLIAARSLWWQWRYGGPQWKGRQLPAGGRIQQGAQSG